MMTPAEHKFHHKHPSKGYAYFSPLTNFVLDRAQIFNLFEPLMTNVAKQSAVLVPPAV